MVADLIGFMRSVLWSVDFDHFRQDDDRSKPANVHVDFGAKCTLKFNQYSRPRVQLR